MVEQDGIIFISYEKLCQSPTQGIEKLCAQIELPASRAEIAAFQSGDVITGIEDLDVENISDVEKMIKKYDKEYKRVYINRYGKIYLMVIK